VETAVRKCGGGAAEDSRVADIAREIRRRSQQVLNNPAGHKGARH